MWQSITLELSKVFKSNWLAFTHIWSKFYDIFLCWCIIVNILQDGRDIEGSIRGPRGPKNSSKQPKMTKFQKWHKTYPKCLFHHFGKCWRQKVVSVFSFRRLKSYFGALLPKSGQFWVLKNGKYGNVMD